MKLSLNGVFWLVTFVFIGASVYFTYNVFSFKNMLSDPNSTIEFPSGQKVTVSGIIDGDEISVSMGDARFIVRILGIFAYDATANDTLTQGHGRAAVNYLEAVLLNREAELVFENLRRDQNKRVLAYVQVNNTDIGFDMIQKGICLVYTKYPFSRMGKYLAAEAAAETKKSGLWGDAGVIIRSRELKKLWEHQRHDVGGN